MKLLQAIAMCVGMYHIRDTSMSFLSFTLSIDEHKSNDERMKEEKSVNKLHTVPKIKNIGMRLSLATSNEIRSIEDIF